MKRTLGSSLAVITALLTTVSFIPQAHATETATASEEPSHAKLQIELRLKPIVGPDGKSQPITRDALDRAAEVFRNRAKTGGIAKPEIRVKMPDRVMIGLPGVGSEAALRWENKLTKVGKLEFRMVHPQSDTLLPQIEAGELILDPAYEIVDFPLKNKAKAGKIIVAKKVEITGDKVTEASALKEDWGWSIHLSFSDEGRQQFADVTGRMAANSTSQLRERFSIMFDHVVISAAGLSDDAIQNGGIQGGSALINSGYDEEETRSIAEALRNPLKHDVEIVLSGSNGYLRSKDAKH